MISAVAAEVGEKVGLAHSTDPGLTVVPEGKCAGAELGLAGPRLLARFLAAPDGSATLVRTAPPGACGRYLQPVDGVTCGVGTVERLP